MTEIALLVVFPLLMAFAAASDLLTMTIPNRLSVALVIAFALFAVAAGLSPAMVATHAAAAAVVLIATFAMFALGWIGGGDAKLAAATALWVGFEGLPDYLLLAAIGGGLLTALILALRLMPMPSFAAGWEWLVRIHDRRSGVPYGIALAAAALAVYPETTIWTQVVPS